MRPQMFIHFFSWLESCAGVGSLAVAGFLFVLAMSAFGFGQLCLWAFLFASFGMLFLLFGYALRQRLPAAVWVNLIVGILIVFLPPQISKLWVEQKGGYWEHTHLLLVLACLMFWALTAVLPFVWIKRSFFRTLWTAFAGLFVVMMAGLVVQAASGYVEIQKLKKIPYVSEVKIRFDATNDYYGLTYHTLDIGLYMNSEDFEQKHLRQSLLRAVPSKGIGPFNTQVSVRTRWPDVPGRRCAVETVATRGDSIPRVVDVCQ